MNPVIWILLASYVALSIVATAMVFRLDYLEKPQAVMHALIAWLIPFLGAVFVLVFQFTIHQDMTSTVGPDVANPNSNHIESDALYHELDSSD